MTTETPAATADPWARFGPTGLSPSRAADFQKCPRAYRYRTVDKMPDPPTVAQVRGTLVHAVLEWLYQQPAADRTLDAAVGRVPAAWEQIMAEDADPATSEGIAQAIPGWEASVQEVHRQSVDLLGRYFTMEDPTVLGNPATEQAVTVAVGGVPLRGKIDRVDIAPTGQVRVVDYKTGKAPKPAYRAEALWQLRFYAVMWRALHGVAPARVRLVYLGGDAPAFVEDSPTGQALDQVEADTARVWTEINTAYDTATFPPRPGPLCPWCPFQTLCPEGAKITRRAPG